MKNIVERLLSDKPDFWKKVQNVGLLITAVSVALASAPFAVPAVILWALGTAGSVTTVLSQLTVKDNSREDEIVDNKKTPEL